MLSTAAGQVFSDSRAEELKNTAGYKNYSYPLPPREVTHQQVPIMSPMALQVTELFTGYVGAMLREYTASPSTAWKSKDCAVYLVVALTVRKGGDVLHELFRVCGQPAPTPSRT